MEVEGDPLQVTYIPIRDLGFCFNPPAETHSPGLGTEGKGKEEGPSSSDWNMPRWLQSPSDGGSNKVALAAALPALISPSEEFMACVCHFPDLPKLPSG
jgi:hypothetical protein